MYLKKKGIQAFENRFSIKENFLNVTNFLYNLWQFCKHVINYIFIIYKLFICPNLNINQDVNKVLV